MKRLITLIALAAATFSCSLASAQVASYNGQLTGTTHDTLTNAAADTVYLLVKGEKTTVSFQYNITKISGTVAGTIKVYGSIDNGSHYALVNSYTLTDATAVAGYVINYNAYGKYRIIVAPTGTQVSSYDIWALYR